jgi:hypothetical protein
LQLAKKTCLEDVKAIETKTYINNPIFPLSSSPRHLPLASCQALPQNSEQLKTQQPEARTLTAEISSLITRHSSGSKFNVNQINHFTSNESEFLIHVNPEHGVLKHQLLCYS